MTSSCGTLAIVLLLGCAGTAALAQQDASHNSPRSPKTQKGEPKPKSAAAAPAPPKAAAPVKVTFEDGQLSILANDARLSDVLAQVRGHTGAAINTPEDMDQRITVDLGPGPAVRIVAMLLEPTDFNFVITTAAMDPRAIESIELTRKPSLLEDLAPALFGLNDEQRAPAPQPQSKAQSKADDDDGWRDVEEPARTPAPPADTAARPPR